MIINKEIWDACIKGFFFTGVAYGFGNTICFLLEEYTEEPHRDLNPETRFLFIYLNQPLEKRYYSIYSDDFDYPCVAYADNAECQEFVVVDMMGSIFFYNKKEEGFSTTNTNITGTADITASFRKIVSVAGNLYTVGSPFRIYKRDNNQLTDYSNGIQLSKEILSGNLSVLLNSRLFDLDGFSESDMYAVGSVGNVFHFNGTKWQKKNFPAHIDLKTITCGTDGNVYITDLKKSLWIGRDNTWTCIIENTEVEFSNTAWFNNRLWCSTAGVMQFLEDGKLISADKASINPMPSNILKACGEISISPDKKKMIVCSDIAAALFDGYKWDLLIDNAVFE